jgi:hypothetical protein
MVRAIEWLKNSQQPDGSWPSDPLNGRSEFNKTIATDAGSAYAVLALDLVGELNHNKAIPLSQASISGRVSKPSRASNSEKQPDNHTNSAADANQ